MHEWRNSFTYVVKIAKVGYLGYFLKMHHWNPQEPGTRCTFDVLDTKWVYRLTNDSETVSTSHSKADNRFRPYCTNVYTVDKILQKRIFGAAALWINEKIFLTEILKFISYLESWDSYFTIDIKWRLLTKKCLSFKLNNLFKISLCAPALQIYWS
jgi:hypothetical protein